MGINQIRGERLAAWGDEMQESQRGTFRTMRCCTGAWCWVLLTTSSLALAQSPDPATPGQLCDRGGRRLHVNCAGTGSPTVIVENGGGSFSVEWALVQSEVAKHTRICTYDRAGYAWSDRGPTDDGIEQIMDDLNLLLRR